MPRIDYRGYAEAFSAWYRAHPEMRGVMPPKGTMQNGLDIGNRAHDLRAPARNGVVSPEEDRALFWDGGLTMDRSTPDRVRISTENRSFHAWKVEQQDRRHAEQVYALYGEGGQARGTMPKFRSNGPERRLWGLTRSEADVAAGPREARALEQYADLPLVRFGEDRFKIDVQVLKGKKPRTLHFRSAEHLVNEGPSSVAAQSRIAEPPGPSQGAEEMLTRQTSALRQFQQDWDRPYAVPDDGAGNDAPYEPALYQPGTMLASAEDPSFAYAPYADASYADAAMDVCMADVAPQGSAPYSEFGGSMYTNPVAAHAHVSQQALRSAPDWQAQQVQQPGPQVYAPPGVAWLQSQFHSQPHSQNKAKGPRPA